MLSSFIFIMENCIIISGLSGSGSTTTGKLLAEKFGLQYFSSGRLFKDIGMGVVEKHHYYPIFEEL